MMRRITALAAAVLLAAACGDADAPAGDETGTLPPPAPADQTGQAALPPDDADLRNVEATLTEWDITLSQDSVAAGAIAFNVRNSGSVVHRFEVEGNGEEWVSEDINPGDQVTMSMNLTPGMYEVYCPVVANGVNHEERGMSTMLHVH